MTEKILVTGCAGFIGGHTVDRLVRDGRDVVGLDNFSTGRQSNMAESWGKFAFLEGSVCDPAAVRAALEGVTRVIHLAAVPSVPRSVENPMESAEASVIGTVTLLTEARRAGVRRIVQAASSSAYGDSPLLPREESQAPRPMSPYAVAKLAQEYYLSAFSKCYGMDGISLRYFNIFGPRQNPESKYAAVIPKFIKTMRAGGRPVIFGDGEQTRDFTYIENAVEANVRAAFADGTFGGVTVNIGAGGSNSLNTLVARLNEFLGTNITPEYRNPRPGDVRDSRASIEKATRLFGYRPSVDFAEGLRRMCAEP